MRASGCGWPTAAVPDGASLPYGRALGDVDSEEDVADAKDGAAKDAAEHRLHQLKEVQIALTGG